MSRDRVLTDTQWALIEPLLPSSEGKACRPFRDHRQVVEGIIFRYRAGCPVWTRHARFSEDGTWDQS